MLLATTTAKVSYVAGLTLVLGSLGAWAILAHQDSSPISAAAKAAMTDEAFAKEAALRGVAEIKLGQLAQTQGSNEAVKSFGARMVTENLKASDQLKEVAAREQIELPTDLAAKDQATCDKLSKLSGVEFDRTYSKDTLKDHQQGLRAFQRESNRGKDDLIRSFALETIPMIQQHLNEAKEMLKNISPKSSRRISVRSSQHARGH